MEPFTLQPWHWYAFEFAGPTFSTHTRFVPAFIVEIQPRKSGKGLLGLQAATPGEFIRTNLRVWQRSTEHLTAAVYNENSLVIRPITLDWLQTYYPHLQERFPFPPEDHTKAELQYYLDRTFDLPQVREPYQSYPGRRLEFRCTWNFRRAEAEGVPLIVEGKHVLDLQRNAIERVKFYFPNRDDLQNNIAFHIDYTEHEVLTACALRFDGYKYVDQALGGDSDILARHMKDGQIPEDDLQHQMAMFFHLQRYLMKWGGEQEPLNSKNWRLFRTLFLAVVNEPVPPAFQHSGLYESWLYNYEPYRAQCIEVVRRIHEATEYDDDAQSQEEAEQTTT